MLLIPIMATLRRLRVLQKHIHTSTCSSSSPALTVTPSSALIDQKVDILLNGLKPNQTVTIVMSVCEGRVKFESRGVYSANDNGIVHNKETPSSGGTFTGTKPMGLFWSLIPKVGQRLFKRDVLTPLKYEMNVFNGQIHDDLDTGQLDPILTTTIERWFKDPSVRRVPLTNAPFKGTVFLPEGEGPFPALVDLYGGLVTLSESRAALLASYGYATFALCYLYDDGLPQKFSENTSLTHVQEAVEWFYNQDYVDKERVGMLGLCYGGYLALVVTSVLPQVKAVVNISGLTMYGGNNIDDKEDTEGNIWPNPKGVKIERGGVVIKDIWNCPKPKPIPVWQHGAKVLQISGMDDLQIDPKWHRFSSERVPVEFKSNFKQLFYPGAGHLIDPPYTPHCSAILAPKERMKSLDFMPEAMHDQALLAGGNAVDHAFAQEDAWLNILGFLEQNLKLCSHSSKASVMS